MTFWRPSDIIRVKVLGLIWRQSSFLAFEVYDDQGHVKGVRPLGGSIEFGETREQALHREFLEELNAKVTIVSSWRFFENIYVHEGAKGHEIVFIAKAEFVDGTYYQREKIEFTEDNGVVGTAGWFDPNDLKSRGVALYPDGLSEHIIDESWR